MDQKLRECLADYAHDAWSGWMRYMFGRCAENEDGSLTLPKELVSRWVRQAATPYSDLSEDEKDSDRREADRMLTCIDARVPAPGSEFHLVSLRDPILARIEAKVWSTPAKDCATKALREVVVRCAVEICHETGDEDSFVEFCAETVRNWMNEDPASPLP